MIVRAARPRRAKLLVGLVALVLACGPVMPRDDAAASVEAPEPAQVELTVVPPTASEPPPAGPPAPKPALVGACVAADCWLAQAEEATRLGNLDVAGTGGLPG